MKLLFSDCILSGAIVTLMCARKLFATSKPRITEHLLLRFLNTISSPDTQL